MRSAQKNNRSRGRGNRKSGGGGGGSIVNRVYDSAGPEGKVRGTPQQIIDKYLSLARDAQTSGDRVMSENFLQHAEHYQRLLMQANAQAEQNRRDQADSASDDEGDERDAGQGDRRGQPFRPQQRQDADTEAEAAGPEEIGGMTMIDSPGGGDDLLVVTEDVSQAKPRRNGDGRRRRQRQGGEEAGQGGSEDTEDTAKAAQQEG
jgi:hypothetical protein